MDTQKIAELLLGTIDLQQRAQAEEELKKFEKCSGFGPALMLVVMSSDTEILMSTRQAGVIRLKNLIKNSWTEPEDGEEPRFHIHEQDRAILRTLILSAFMNSHKEILQYLCESIGIMCKADFPIRSRWNCLVESLGYLFPSKDDKVDRWHAAILALLEIIKGFNYQIDQERQILFDLIKKFLPIVYSLINEQMADISLPALTKQRLVLKAFFAMTHHHLPFLTQGNFSQWMEIVRLILDRSSAEFETKPEDDGDKDELAKTKKEWWKTKKWAMRILYRMFERYRSPSGAPKEYQSFSDWFKPSGGALQVVLKIMDSFRHGSFVADKVLKDGLLYLKKSVSNVHVWKYIKPRYTELLSGVVYPLMCHTEKDETLWKEDPVEYITLKYGDVLDKDSVVWCAEQLLIAIFKEEFLPKCSGIVTEILSKANKTSKDLDGAFHLVGTIADILLKKDQLLFDNILIRIFRVFNPNNNMPGFLRARCAWLLLKLSTLKFSQAQLEDTIRVLIGSILKEDEEMPVKIEAALGIGAFVQEQRQTHEFIKPKIRHLTVELLNLLSVTRNDELRIVLQKIVCNFVEDIPTIAQYYLETFMGSVRDVEGEKRIIAMSSLNAMETILVVMEEQPEVCRILEPTLLQVVRFILDKSIMEFYEEAFSLIECLTKKKISPEMWTIFDKMCGVIERDGVEYFIEMMPCLYNYITVGTDCFLQESERSLAVCNILKRVLLDEPDRKEEDAQRHAAKLVEVIILQCGGRIRTSLPNLLESPIERLDRGIKCSEFRIMCLQVVVAGLYVDFQSVVKLPNLKMDEFVKQWLADTDCFLGLHDRKICVLGLCTLLKSKNGLTVLQKCSKKVLPSIILLLEGLKRSYAAKALENGDDDDDSEHSGEKAALECYATPLDDKESPVDEFIIFKDVMHKLEILDPKFYRDLTNVLNQDQWKTLQEIFKLADQREAAAKVAIAPVATAPVATAPVALRPKPPKAKVLSVVRKRRGKK